MDEKRLSAAIAEYRQLLDDDPDKLETDFEERDSRAREYQCYSKEDILAFEDDDLVEYLGKLWALRMWGNKRYRVEKIIDDNGGAQNLKAEIAELLYGTNDIANRWDRFVGSVKGLGSAAASELLSYQDSEKYAIFNGTTVKALDYLGASLKAKYEHQRDSKKYFEVCELSRSILKKLRDNGIPATDLLHVDYFLWDVVRPVASMDGGTDDVPTDDKEDKRASATYHTEVKNALVAIGEFLGFESRSEVKVATGAIVDAVWEATIGNMGKAIYVFEVQSGGSIDSLILNLKKAQSNPAVQAIVAVSDSTQLQKILDESEGVIAPGVLRTWESEDVLATCEHLSIAHDSINSLELVPESF